MDQTTLKYRAACSSTGCTRPPRYKIAAPWSYGPLRELKNYGLTCAEHCESLLARARASRENLAVGDDEVVGPVELFALAPGHRDVELPRLDGPAR